MAEQEQLLLVDQEGVDNVNQMAQGGGAKRTAEESQQSGESPSNKKQRGDGDDEHYEAGEGPEITLRFLIQSQNAGGIIGKGGLNIKRLRTEYNAGVTVPDCFGPERVLTISGKFGDVMGCLEDIMPFLKEGGRRRGQPHQQQQQQQEDGDSEARLLVHQSSAGAIIGRAGFKIKELREKSKAQIKVYTECCPNSSERVVQFNGTAPLVVEGIRRTLKVVQEAPIKGPVQYYDPFCYNGGNYGGHGVLDVPPAYGAFPPVQGRMGMGGPDRRGRGGPFMMRGGRPNMGGRQYGGGSGGNRGQRRVNEPFDYSRDRDSDNFSFPEKTYEGEKEGETYTQVTIPRDLAGSIIGTRGERINEIRRRSGAKIKIAEALPGSNDRIITISGDDEEITNAQYLLQLSVKRYSGKSGY